MIAARQIFLGCGAGGGGWVNPYVTDGLVAMWDGEWNAGGGVHDANATVWKDLVGTTDITLSRTTVGDDYIYFPKGSNNGYGTADFPTSYGAIEIVLSKSINYNNSAYECCIISIGSVYSGLGICAPKDDVTDTYDAGEAPYITIQDGELFSVSLNKSGVATTEIAKNGVIGSVGIKTKGSRYSIGSQCLNGGASGGLRSSEMYIKSIRIYSRTLTAAEIAANYVVDKARFNLP